MRSSHQSPCEFLSMSISRSFSLTLTHSLSQSLYLTHTLCPSLPLSLYRCGGCGSKVGASVLSRALRKVKSLLHSRPEVIAGIGGKSGTVTHIIISLTLLDFMKVFPHCNFLIIIPHKRLEILVLKSPNIRLTLPKYNAHIDLSILGYLI